ncbi:hypothetical protein [Micromonospora sp. WMMD812]|uniref:hypothetical protein n=1 Tax=Micromonospora sp. WMMD812 TaxID=3015152 RepID=UPI00248C773B|nr:hypothetical protein [Micromonospora sp. WMMD812]WBB69926.1 hypothetical protein O7603_11455 [Micromonospora sp. WMMD812]
MNAPGMDQETVERMLSGPVVDAGYGPHPLDLLLAAVRAAPLPGELDGEHAAVQAFRRALAEPAGAPARPRPTVTTIGVRAALAALAVAATGGVALAATTGTPQGPAGTTPAPAPSTPAVEAAPSGPGRGSTPVPGTETRPTPGPSLTGLCRAYRAQVGDNPGKARENPAFAALITAAGGRELVPDYCDRLLTDERTRGTSAGRPAHPTRPTAPPTAPPGRPADPGGAGQDPPTGGGRAGEKKPAAGGLSGD